MELLDNLLKDNSDKHEKYYLKYYDFKIESSQLVLFINYKKYTFSEIHNSSNKLVGIQEFFDNWFYFLNSENYLDLTELSQISHWKKTLEYLIFDRNEILTDLSKTGYYVEFTKFSGQDFYDIHEGFRVKTDNLKIESLTRKIKAYEELKYISHYLMNITENNLYSHLNRKSNEKPLMQTDNFTVDISLYLNYSYSSKNKFKNLTFEELKKSDYFSFSVQNKQVNFYHQFNPNDVINGIIEEIEIYPLNYHFLLKRLLHKHSRIGKKTAMPTFDIEEYKIKKSEYIQDV